MFVPSDKKPRSFKDHILIVPVVSVGNVPQLSADLLISTLCMHRCGFIQHSSILPLVGGDPFAHPDATSCKIVTCCEEKIRLDVSSESSARHMKNQVLFSLKDKSKKLKLSQPMGKTEVSSTAKNRTNCLTVFESVEHQVLIIQQRAPFVKGRRCLFRKWLVEWIKEQKFKRVVIATSSSAQERLDAQLEGPQFRFLASPQIDKEFGDMFRDFYEWTELERRPTFPAPSAHEEKTEDKAGGIYIPGGGIAKSLFQDLCSEVPVVVFLMFCAEGDNAVEAIELTNRLNRWLSLIMFHSRSIVDANEGAIIRYSQWKVPTSWKLFYGSKFDQTLFH